MARTTKIEVKHRYDRSSAGKAEKYLDPVKARYYRSLYVDHVVGFVEAFERRAGGPARVLDVGTGAGLYPYYLEGGGRTVVGLDISQTAVSTARRYLGDTGCQFLLGDGAELPFPDDSFDLATAIGTFEYVEDLAGMFEEFGRVLVGDGGLVAGIHNARGFNLEAWKARHEYERHAHTVEGVRSALAAAGFELVEYRTTHFVTTFQKILINDPRVPEPVRRVALALTTAGNAAARRVPGLRERGDSLIVYAVSGELPQQ